MRSSVYFSSADGLSEDTIYYFWVSYYSLLRKNIHHRYKETWHTHEIYSVQSASFQFSQKNIIFMLYMELFYFTQCFMQFMVFLLTYLKWTTNILLCPMHSCLVHVLLPSVFVFEGSFDDHRKKRV